MQKNDIAIKRRETEEEKEKRNSFVDALNDINIPKDEKLENLGLFLNRKTLSRILFMHHIYQKIIPVHGSVIEFGCRWGQNLALFSNFRGIYEPYNFFRKIIGFDTFSGFSALDNEDFKLGKKEISQGDYSVSKGYEDFLAKVLDYHESESPIPHIKKYEIIKGDVTETLTPFLEDNPETIIALAYFDMDVYKPTKYCLEKIKPYLTKGSVIGFDELCHANFPGETVALREALGIDSYRICRVPYNPATSYVVIE